MQGTLKTSKTPGDSTFEGTVNVTEIISHGFKVHNHKVQNNPTLFAQHRGIAIHSVKKTNTKYL